MNEKIGYLTTISEPYKQFFPKSNRNWEVVDVRCECGNTKTVKTHNLGTNTISCGCFSKNKTIQRNNNRASKNLIGQKYGKFTIISESFKEENQKHDYRWVFVKCECGNERKILYSSLRSGNSKSCGCARELFKAEKIKTNRCNKIKNADTESILKDWNSGVSLKQMSIKYKLSVILLRRYLQSLGLNTALKTGKDNTQFTGYQEIQGCLWTSIINGAKKRGLPCTITLEYVWNLFLEQNRKCALSGVVLVFGHTAKKQIETTASLDRIDSSKGYIEGNVQWVHKKVNALKMALSDKELIHWCSLISQNNLIG